MSRALLFSLLVIGFVCGFVGRATYASFGTENLAEGDVKTGTLEIGVDNTNLEFSLSFPITAACPDAMRVGEMCYVTKQIENTGNLAGVLSVDEPLISIDSPYCDDENFFATAGLLDVSAGEAEGGTEKLFPSDDLELLRVEVTLTGIEGHVSAECEGATATVSVTLSLVQAADPHGSDDEE